MNEMNEKHKAPACKHCWDKKYNTTVEGGDLVTGDFEGDMSYRTAIRIVSHPCPRCDNPKKDITRKFR